MKRLIFVISVVFLSLGLAGCDMISPEQVEEISEEFCRENPTSEICEGDLVGELEDEIILNVFNRILDEYNDETNTTFCEDYFSVTNTELLDSCRESKAGLIPESYEGFTVSDVVKKTTITDQDVFEITVVSEDLTVEIVFTIGLVNVEGIMFINTWSFESNETTPAEQDVSLEAAKAYFEEFIADYLDAEQTSYDVCTKYFGEDITGCVTDRDRGLDINFSVILNNMVESSVPSIFDVELSFDDDEMTEVKIEFEKISFSYDEEGNIVMTFIDGEEEPPEENWLSAEDAFDVIAQFLADYNGYDVSHEVFNYIYFDDMMAWQFFQDRNIERDKGVALSVVLVEEPTEEPFEYLLVTMQRTFEGETKTMIVELRINDLGEDKYYFDILFENEAGKLDYDMLWNYMLNFVVDYQDTILTDQEICEQYFPDDELDDCMEHRSDQLASGVTITLNSLVEVEDYYKIEFEFDDGVEDPWIEEVFANFYYDDLGNLKVEFNDLGFDEIDYYFALSFMNNLVDQYSNYELPSYDVCIQFFEGHSYDECVVRREQEIADGITLDDFELFHDGYGYRVEYYYTDSEGLAFQKNLNAYFYYNEVGDLRLEFFEDFALIPYEVVLPFMEQLVVDFNNWGMDTEYMCNYYFGMESALGCIEKRNEAITNNVTIALFLFGEEYDHYRVEFEYDDGENTWYESMNAFFYYDEYENLKVDFKGDGPEQFPYDDAYNFFQQFLVDFSDPELLDSDFCTMYFPGMGENCLWDRSIMPLEHMQIQLNWMNYDGYMYETELEFINNYNNETWKTNVYLEFYYDEYGNIGMHLYENQMNQYLNFNDSFNIIQQYILDYMDRAITFEQLNAWYFDYQMDYSFQDDRELSFTDGRVYTLYEVLDPYGADGQDFLEVYIDITENGIAMETMVVWMRVLPMGNGYHLIEFKDEQHHDNIDLTYDEALTYMQQFINDYTSGMSSYDTCSVYFNSFEYPLCMVKRDAEMNEGISVELGVFDLLDDGFYAELVYYDYAHELLYSEYVHIFFFNGERGELKLSFDNYNYNKSFPYDEALAYVNGLLLEFMDPDISNDDYCNTYGLLFDDCHMLRTEIFRNNGAIYFSNFWHNRDNIFYFEYGYQTSDGSEAIYMGFELEFYYDEFGNLMVNIWDQGPNFHYASFIEAQTFYTQFLADYMNDEILTKYIVSTYFNNMVVDDFYDRRTQDLANGLQIDLADIVYVDEYLGDGIDWITVTYNTFENDIPTTVAENFRVMITDGVYQIEIEYFNPEAIDYNVAYDFIDLYVTELLDDTLSDEDFCSFYTEDWVYDNCMMSRADLIAMYSRASILEFYYDVHMHSYRVTIDLFDEFDVFMDSKNFELHFWYNLDGELKLELFDRFEHYDPLYDELFNLMVEFHSEYVNPAILSVDFCNEYFPEDPNCATMREIVLDSIGGYVWVEDFYWYTYCDDEGYCDDEILYEAMVMYDLTDGNFIRQRITVTPWWDEEENLHVTLVVTDQQSSVPADAVLLTQSETITAAQAFAINYSDPDISTEVFCNMYFNGNVNCIDDRDGFIAAGGVAVYDSIEAMLDHENETFYLIQFEFTINDEQKLQEAAFRIWKLPNQLFFIEFIDYRAPVNHQDSVVATITEAEMVYRDFLHEYTNLANSDEYICNTYFLLDDISINCVEGRQQFLSSGGFTGVISIVEIFTPEGEDNYFVVTLEQNNPYDSSISEFDLAFYAYVDTNYNTYIIEIDPLPLPTEPK